MKRRNNNNLLKIALGILLPVVALIAFLIFRSSFFNIKSIEIVKNNIACADDESLRGASQLLDKNIFLIDSKKLSQNIKIRFYCIKEVNLSRIFPNSVRISFFGREPAAILLSAQYEEATKSGELDIFSEVATLSAEASSSANFNFRVDSSTKNFVIDKEGVIFSKDIEQINAPRVYVSGLNLNLGQKIKEQVVFNLLKVLEKIKIFGINIKDAKMYSEKILLINGVPRIIFKLDSEVDTQIASLQLILEKAKIDQVSLEFIDLRFDKPIVKFAPKKK